MKPHTDIAQRSLIAISWMSSSNLISMSILLMRSILLARLLPVEVFGVYGAASAIISVAVIPAVFGLDRAFVHRSEFTQDESSAARIHFSLMSISTGIWLACMSLVIWLLSDGALRISLLVLTATSAVTLLCLTPLTILERRVVHRRRALEAVLSAALTTLAAVWLAWLGYPLLAILSTNIVSALLLVLMVYVWRPVWRPTWGWSTPAVRYFLGFGGKSWLASLLTELLNRGDDLWVSYYLGAQQMGYYSRAYTFATYPRQILAGPIYAVTGGAYAELKEEPEQLSKAFFRSNAFLVRAGFLVTGIMLLIAPEFIRLALGDKWLPMLTTFRLLLIFALLEPLRSTISDLFLAVGAPIQLVWTRLAQLGVLIVGLFVLGSYWGIEGAAVAVNLMILLGIGVMLYRARQYVRFSLLRLFLAPSLALLLALTAASIAQFIPGVQGADWRTAATKIIVFSGVYLAVLWLLEGKSLQAMLNTSLKLMFSDRPGQTQPPKDADNGAFS